MPTETENLWCKVGGHFWDRPVTRGRKPIACPDHRAADIAAMPVRAPGLDMLRRGSREADRFADLTNPETGLMPGEVAPQPRTETLRCEAGHEWTREATRGRKPRWCPRHRPEPENVSASPAEASEMPSRPKVITRARSAGNFDEIVERFHLKPGEEAYRKLHYLDGRLRQHGLSQSDYQFSAETQRMILSRLEREHRRAGA